MPATGHIVAGNLPPVASMIVDRPLLHPGRTSIAKLEPWLDVLAHLASVKLGDAAQVIDRLVESAASGELQVFVGHVDMAYALPIRATAWGGSHGAAFGARESAASGWLVLEPAAFPNNAPERALAYQPLFTRQNSLPEWAARRPPSAKRLRDVTKEIVTECDRNGRMLAQQKFALELAARTGASLRQALRHWPDTPRPWHRRGPKGSGNR